MPLFKQYTKDMDCSLTADLRNTQKTVGYVCTQKGKFRKELKYDVLLSFFFDVFIPLQYH